jgi:deoxyadenosine/deoxycytidine kinase
MNNNKLSIFIQGNIGSGKSKIINILRNNSNYEIIDEPVTIWEKTGALKGFYENKQKRAYTFQSFTFISRLKDLLKPTDKKIKIYERSIYADKYCFAQNAHDCGFIDDYEWKIYNYIFDEWIDFINILKNSEMSGKNEWTNKVINEARKTNETNVGSNEVISEAGTNKDIILFIKCSPEKCKKRINLRNRNSESNIDFDYIKKLDDIHEKWIKELANDKNFIVEELNNEEDYVSEEEYTKKINKKIEDIINKYQK